MSEEKKTDNKETKASKENGIVSIHDFKSMLVGMDMVLGDNWTPNEDQWKRIRAKLDALIESAEREPITIRRSGTNPSLDNQEHNLVMNFPTVPGGVPEGVPVGQPGPAGPSALAPPPPQPPQPAVPHSVRAPVADGREQVKTPDIDSSDGYKSSFV